MKIGKPKFQHLFTIILTVIFLTIFIISVFYYQKNLKLKEDREKDSLNNINSSAEVFIKLTDEEKKWLSEHPVITVVQDLNWHPVEFADERGEPSGIANDYLKIIEERLGIKFKQIKKLNWQDAYSLLKKWKIDMTTCVALTPDRTEFWAFTKPYLSIPIVVLTHMNVTYIGSMKELEGKKIAVVEGYAFNEWVIRDFPEIQLIKVNSVKEGITLLQRNEVFAFIDNMLVIGYYMAKLKISNLKVAGDTPYVNAQSMAVRKDWAIFAGVLQKALDSISESERLQIYQEWVPMRYDHGFDYTLFWKIFLLFLSVVAGLIVWNHKLTKEINYRKKAEDALKKSEIFLSNIIENIPIMIFLKNVPDLRFVKINKAAEELMGYTREKLLDKNDHDFFPKSEADFFIEKDREAVKSGKIIEIPEETIHTKDKGERVLHTKKIIIFDDKGKPEYLLGISEDITERKITEKALKKSEERYKRMLHSISDYIFSVKVENEKTVSTDYGEGCIGITGYSSEEFLNDPYLWYKIIHEEDRAMVTGLTGQLIKGIAANPFEHRIVHKDGSLRWIRNTSVARKNDDGMVIAYDGLIEDITERKLVELEIKKLNEELENKIEERTRKLELSNKELEAFSYSVSHDLKAPLRAILGFSTLVMDKLYNTDDEANKYLLNINIAAGKMSALIDDLLNLSKITRQEMDKMSLDISSVAESINNDFSLQSPERKVDFKFVKKIMVYADLSLIKIVMQNLLSNAWKYTSKTEIARIEFGKIENDVYFIKDNGVGFDMRYAEKLFNPFQRLHSSNDFEGTGIGLAIVKRIIEKHNGRIWVESEINKGTIFYFTLGQ